MPAALSTGVGSETQRPFAVVIIGGLVTAVPVTLFVLPVLYSLIVRKVPLLTSDEDATWKRARRRHRDSKRSRHSGSVTVVVISAGPASAGQASNEALPQRVTLDDVLQLLNERSPERSADRATVDVVAADRVTANTLPNPSISYGGLRLVSGLSTGALNQDQVVIDQPLLLFGQRQARRDLADRNVAAEQAHVAATLADRRLEVRQAFAELVARQEEWHILQESRGELQRIEQIVRGRASAGDRSQYDVLRIETEGGTLDVELMNASTDVDDASGHLAALLGLPGWRPSADGRLEPGPTPTNL